MYNIESSLISICIPTYNRASSLKIIMPELISTIKEYNFEILIVDNASSDDTKEVVDDFKKIYNTITYHRQDENVGADKNFEAALRLSKSKYAWLLGDTNLICKDELYTVLNILQTGGHAAVLVNSDNRVKNVPSQVFTDPTLLLKYIGWHITLLCSIIFSKSLIENASFKRYYNSNFIQTGIVFEYLVTNPATSYWHSGNAIMGLRKRSGWVNDALLVFAQRWTLFVLSLPPSIPLNIKLSCIKDHGIKSGVFSLKSLIRFRMDGHITKVVYKKYKSYLFYNTKLSTYIIFYFLMLIPSNLFWNEKQLGSWFRNKYRKP